jgi:hypothetical protein
VYAQRALSIGNSCGIYYKLGITGTETFLATVSSEVCSLRGTITGIPNGTVLYIGFRSISGYIRYNAVNSASACPSNLNTYCGTDYNLTITGGTSISLTAYVNAGAYELCTPIYTTPTVTPTKTPTKSPSITPSITVSTSRPST